MIYISGKITGTTDYIERFAETEEMLRTEGCTVINPARTCATLPVLPWSGYMTVAMSLLSLCDAIYMLPDWTASKGAIIEHYVADKILGIDVMYEIWPSVDPELLYPQHLKDFPAAAMRGLRG